MDLTVAICTFKRGPLLKRALDSLAACAAPAGAWEVVVLDNGCEETVEALVKTYEGRLPIRYEREPTQGLAHARNAAVKAARAKVIAFSDDDVRFDPHWLANLARAVQEHSHCSFWGGRIEPDWPSPAPGWFDLQRCPQLAASIVALNLGERSRLWEPEHDPAFYGANLAFTVEAIRANGMFDPSLGHTGKRLGTGEDSWMVRSISRAGGLGWYVADAVVHHPVPAQRLTRNYARGFARRQGRLATAMLRRENGGKIPRWLYRYALTQVLRGLGRWAGGVARLDAALAFSGEYAMIFNSAKIIGAIGGRGRA